MDASNPSQASHQDWLEQNRLLRKFEDAWQQGEAPALDEFLPTEAALRVPVLVELIHIDLEYRVKAGQTARVEDYLRRYPELAGHRAAVLDLIGTEQRLRRRREADLDLVEYTARFPELAEPLCARWPKQGPAPLTPPAGLSCPHCGQDLGPGVDTLTESVVCSACGAQVGLEGGAPAAGMLGKYRLLEVVGRGGFGIVYRAHDTELDRIVALKVPRRGSLASPAEIDRFLREARNAAQLRHPNIVAVHDAGRIGDTCYLASDFVEGRPLELRPGSGQVSHAGIAELLSQVARALHYAHQQGVVHRDLKPSNILLDRLGRPHLLDFGLAKRDAADITLTLAGELLGTPAYMSPEQARGEAHSVDRRSDVYSLGVIFYEVLTGELPFRGNLRMVLLQVQSEEPRPPRRLNNRVPRDLETICLKAMAKEPGRRYPSAEEVADDLDRWRRGEPIQARSAGWLERVWRLCRGNRRAVV